MRGRIGFVLGAGVGYVLGTRAGRQQFEKIKQGATGVWNNPKVQGVVHDAESQVQSFAKDRGTALKDKALDVAKDKGMALKDKAVDVAKGALHKDDAPAPPVPPIAPTPETAPGSAYGADSPAGGAPGTPASRP